MSKIILNVVEPGSGPTPIDPVVPNTGLFTHGIGGPEATIITVSIVAIIAIVALVLYYKKKHSKSALNSKKHISTGLVALALLVSTGTFIALAKNAVNAADTDEIANEDKSGLTVDVSDEDFTIEVADSPVFAVLPVELTVEEATEVGYTLTASAADTNLVSTTDSSNIIPMVTVPEEGELVALADNTYGLALSEPEDKDSKVYTALSTDADNPTLITDKAYEATEANDTTTIYYGFYITPDVPYGTYVSSSEVVYDAIPNLATVTFDANGLYYSDDESFTTNTVGYKPNVAEAPIEEVTGEYLAPAPLTPSDPSTSIYYTFLGWSEDKDATEATYVDEEDILANLTLTKNESLTLYAVWHYNTVLSFNGNTSDGGEPIADITIPAGTTITLPPNTYTRTGSVFINWNTVAEPTEQDPGEAYEDQANFTAPDSSADITLYAQWAYYTTITFSGNGADSGTMSPQTIVAGNPTNLTPNSFTKTNHTFIGWNTSPDGTGTSYEDQAEFVASTTQHEDITLYAQWASTTISFNGNTSESGTMNPIIIPGGEQVTLPQNTYTKSHCSFTSWNTNPDGTGTRYPGEASYTASMDGIYSFTLYAQWQCESLINFNGNGATSGEMSSIMVTGGQPTTLPQNTFAKDGYFFASWNTKADGTGESYTDQGTYAAPASESKTITLYVQWTDCAPNNICYNDNGANSLTTMDPQSASSNTDVELWASNYKYDVDDDGHNDYGFAGWSEDKDAATKLTDNDPTNNPVVYGPNQTITTGDLSTEGMKLYAVWIAPEQNTSFQDFTCPTNTDMPIGTVIALKDNRDNEVYTVAKLADGNCWMTENLRLDNNATINATNTNSPISSFTALSPSSNSWCTSSSASCLNQSMLNTNNSANPVSPMTGTNANIYSYSNYYNWYSATAGNGTRSISSGTVSGDLCPAGWHLPYGGYGTDTKGGNTSGGFYYLNQQMGGGASAQASKNWRSFPNNFVYSGSWNGSSANGRGGYGHYWSSTANGTYDAYYLYFSSGYVLPGTGGDYKYIGYSVRCVAPVGTTITFDGNGNTGGEMPKQRIAQNTTVPLDSNKFTKGDDIFVSWNTERDGSGTSYTDGQSYTTGEGSNNITLYAQWKKNLPSMQDVATWGSTLAEGDEITVVDSRDGTEYTVARLADNNIWMTQNLDLNIEAGRTYTSADTDLANSSISTTWTPTSSEATYPTGTTTWNSSSTTPESYDPGDLYWDGTPNTNWDGNLDNETVTDPSQTSGGTHYRIGNYYNWTAAVAMSDSSLYTSLYTDVNQSICPAGWRLPTYEGDKSYQNLVNAQSLTAGTSGNIQNSPVYFVYGGDWYGSSEFVGRNGLYWSSVVYSGDYPYVLYFRANGELSPQGSNSRKSGYLLRCVAR